jgi:type IV pilus biogenesis protein CpaD/CtpE
VKRGGLAFIVLAAVLAVAVVLGGCGSDSDSTASLSKAEYKKQAEVVCQSYESEREEVLGKALEEAGSNPNAKQKEKLLLTVLATYEKMTEEIADLGTPEGEEQKAEAMIESMEEAIDRAKANPESAFTSDLPFREANKQVKAMGLDNCVA